MVEAVQQMATSQMKRDSRSSLRKAKEKQIDGGMAMLPTLGNSGGHSGNYVRTQREFIAAMKSASPVWDPHFKET